MRAATLLINLTLAGWLAGGCTNRAPLEGGLGAFRVSIVGNPNLGSAKDPLPFSVKGVTELKINIEAMTYDGAGWVLDQDYSGFAVVNVQPSGKLVDDPQVVRLNGGRASNVPVGIRMAFGAVRLVVSDPGFHPADKPGSALCNSNQIDEDGDGFADYPNDRGCYTAGDDSEVGGTGSAGASSLITFANPRIEDIQTPGSEADKSAMQGLRATVDRGFMLVSRVSTDGLYVTDYDGARWDAAGRAWMVNATEMYYRSIFAFNFSTPINIVEGECLVQLDGTVDEFYNYTELGKPTWKKGDFAFCATLARDAGLSLCNPADTDEAKVSACRIQLENLSNTPFDLTKLLVDLPTGAQVSVWDPSGVQAERFESSLVQLSDVEMFTELRRCDRNGNNVVDYGVKEEADCSNDCGSDVRCVVAETYERYKQWTVHFRDGKDVEREVSIVTQGAMPKFDPMVAFKAHEGKAPLKLGKVVGTMRHLGFGRPAWTLEPRRVADCPDCIN